MAGRILRRAALLAFMAMWLAAMGWAYIVFVEESASLQLLPFALLSGTLFLYMGRRPENVRKRAFWSVLFGMTALYMAVSLWFMQNYRYTPVWDPDAVFTGAQSWLAGSLTAQSTPTYDAATYFYYFPNNLGAVFVLRWWFALTQGMDAYIAACTLNMLLSACMIVFTGLAARETGGEKMGLTALVILGCTLPVWFSCAAFYTDFLSICFPVGAYFFALKANRARCAWKKGLFYALFGFMAALGAMIKITVLILPIGVCIWQALRGKWRGALAFAVAAGLMFGAGQLMLHKSVYPAQLDPEKSAQMNTPIGHWIMMGLRGDGYYNGWDYEFTRSFDDMDTAKEAINGEIVRRVRDMGPVGFVEHIFRKMGICMSDGTLMLSDYYDDSPVGPQWCKELLLPGGKMYGAWKAVCGGVHMAQMALALAGAVRCMRKKAYKFSGALYLCLLGLLVFLSMWETSRRYWINFMPVLALCAAQGACGLQLPFGARLSLQNRVRCMAYADAPAFMGSCTPQGRLQRKKTPKRHGKCGAVMIYCRKDEYGRRGERK